MRSEGCPAAEPMDGAGEHSTTMSPLFGTSATLLESSGSIDSFKSSLATG